MDAGAQTERNKSGLTGRLQPLHSPHRLYIGIDIGSTSSDIVVLDGAGSIIICDYKRTKGRSIETVRYQMAEVFSRINPTDVVLAAATGSAGRFVARLLDVPFVNEVPAQAEAICHLYPNLKQATIIEMGGQDSKLIFLTKEDGRAGVRDFALNTVCAAGTGSFLDQQAQRLGIDIENQFGQLALQSKNIPRMAGRCSVFAKSDMIHLQQQATPNCDIIAGLCLALARNLKSNLGCGRKFVKPLVFTGGVAANTGVVRALEPVFDLDRGQLIVPKEHFFTGAIGAVLLSKKRFSHKRNGRIRLEKIDSYLAQRTSALQDAPRRQPLNIPSLQPPESVVYDYLLSDKAGLINAYLGVDVGSISTNVAVIDEKKRVLAKAYLMTAGRPLEAVRQGLDMVGARVAGKVKILGAATTGSGRYLTGDFIGADVVINEITAQAAGAAIVNPNVDTIFEIGGQDSKYISLENGVVVDFEMNHACAAGTGSFLEEQAQRLGININEEFAQLAFNSTAPVKLGERCTVFMESDLLNYQQQGAKTEDLVAGLSYSIVENYLNRVVGRRKIGDNICFQGGTAFNKAVWAAFEKTTAKPIMVPDHHEVTGAIGAASIAAENMKKTAEHSGKTLQSNFRGFENLAHVDYSVESFACEHCPNNCEIKKVQLPQTQPLYYGSRCDRYNLKKKTLKSKAPNAFEYRRQKLLEFAGLTDKHKNADKTGAAIGIPMALVNWQLLPLFSQFFKLLGFNVVLSGRTDKRIIRMGVETVTAQTCFPVKVAYGHIAELIEKQVDYIFLPSIVSMTANFPMNRHNQLCPYVQSFPYQARTAFADKLNGSPGPDKKPSEIGRTKILIAPIRMGEGQKLLRKTFTELGRQLDVSASQVRKVIKQSFSIQRSFEDVLKQKGAEILSQTGAEQKLFVLISRPYNGCDEGLNLQLPKKLAELGVQAIPMDMLNIASAEIADESLHRQVYWTYGQKILRAAEIIKKDPRLFAIYLSNFGCGPDSFLMTFFKDIMAQKPCLQLELDEHSADAGVITRLEAFFESLKHYRHKQQPQRPTIKPPKKIITSERKLYIPYMSDCAYGVAACFKAYGQPAEVMPVADDLALLQGRKFTTGKECLPCAITTGDMLKVITAEDFDPQKTAFLMPGSSGPCRFGMYSCMHRLVLRYAGVADVPVISPNQDGSFYKDFTASINGSATGSFPKDLWTAAVGIDLLIKLILRLRPFAKDARQAQHLYEKSLRRWVRAIEKRGSLSQLCRLMDNVAEEFADLPLDLEVQKPTIGIVGELYVRRHPFANMNLIARLEELGAACSLASLAEWIYYTNFTRNNQARRWRQLGIFMTNMLQDYFQKKIEKILAQPLERRFGRLAEVPIEKVIELGQPYLHHSFEGEAILSIGKMIEFYHHGLGGVINVMPFSCMPSTIVSTQTMRISSDCDEMPVLNLSFDGQEDSTLTTRLEAFVEQVRQRQTSLLSASALCPTKEY
ncbi:MAG: acyl-CoA dehydratase activase [Planctomycetota bacterium]|jgi:predicted CoA-substrate-specific enzyme activase